MSVLIVTGGDPLAEIVARRLVDQGDEVRVLEEDPSTRDRWRAVGVHVAVGDPADEDLVERAAQNVRTVVLLGAALTTTVVEAVIEGAGRAGADRLIACGAVVEEPLRRLIRSSRLDHVILATGRAGLLRRSAAPALVAEAIDAADDLAGAPRLELDLTQRAAVRALGLAGPDA